MVSRTILVNASYAPSLLAFRGDLLREMVQARHRVIATAPDLSDRVADELRSFGVTPVEVRLSRTGLNLIQDVAYWYELRGVIEKNGVDLVFGYTIKPCIWGSLAASSRGVESHSMVTGLGFAFSPKRGFKQRMLKAASVTLWRAATASNRSVIFQNPDDLADFIAAGGLVDRSKARLVNGSGVNLDQFQPTPLPPEASFLMVARLLGAKGVREYATAAMRRRQEGSTARFALAGYFDEGPDGVDPGEVEQWRNGGVDYIGPLADVRPALAEASVFVLPSYREGTPRTVLEAMACGRPVITTDVPGCRETVEDGVSGVLVPPRDATALCDAFRMIEADGEKRRAMGQAALRRCGQRFEVGTVNKTMFRHLGLSEATDVTQSSDSQMSPAMGER